MAQNATINLNAVDNTRAAFLAVQRNLGNIAKSSSELTGKIARLGVGMLGLGSAMSVVQGEVRNLVRNIEEVPDVNERAAASVIYLREQLSATFSGSSPITKGVLALIDGFVTLARVQGMVFASFETLFSGRPLLSLKEMIQLFQEMRDESVDALRVAQVEAMERRFRSLNEQLDKARNLAAQAMAPLEGASIKGRDKIQAVEEAISRQRILIDSLGRSYIENAEKLSRVNELTKEELDLVRLAQEENLKQQIESYNEVNKLSGTLKTLKREESRVSEEAGKIMANGFEEAIFSGRKLSDVIKQLGTDLLRLMFRRSITTPLADFFSGGISNIFGGPRAMGGPVSTGKSYLVGERGPEIFTPTSAGNIISNEKSTSGGQGGSTYYIDARGADQTGLARLEGLIRQTQASIKPIALGAVMDARMRGGALA